jgi:hypothetical protein
MLHEAEFKSFTEDLNNVIKRYETVIGNGDGLATMVYFERLGETTQKESAKLTWIKEKAQHLIIDDRFNSLSNKKQRELYLLDKYTINSSDAEDIIEYLNMIKKIAGE